MMALSERMVEGALPLLLMLVVAFPLHELGHLLALRLLGEAGRIVPGLGLGVNLPPSVAGYRLALVAAGGPLANLLMMKLALIFGWQTLAQVNFVLAAVNLLPMLPLDGGRVLLGLLSRVWSWRGVAESLLFLARCWAIALVICVYYFGLSRWLIVAALWLYLLAMAEGRHLGYQQRLQLWACRGAKWRKVRNIRVKRDVPIVKVWGRFSPGWQNVVWYHGRKIDGDRLLDKCEAGGAMLMLSEVIKSGKYANSEW